MRIMQTSFHTFGMDGSVLLPNDEFSSLDYPTAFFSSMTRAQLTEDGFTARSQLTMERITAGNGKHDIARDELRQTFSADPCLWRNNMLKDRNSRCPEFVRSSNEIGLSSDSLWTTRWVEEASASLKEGPADIDWEVRASHPSDSCERYGGMNTRMVANYSFLNSYVPWESLCKPCNSGEGNELIQAVKRIDEQGECVSTDIIFGLLQRCIDENDVQAGRDVHHLIVRMGLESDVFLGSHLIRMFAIFGSLSQAKQVFDKLPNPNVYSWSAIIKAHTKLGQNEAAIKLYCKMLKSCEEPDGAIFAAALKACSDIGFLEQGKTIHAHIVENGFESDEFIVSTLVDMYSKCGSPEDAQIVFDRLPKHNDVAYSALITGYVQQGNGKTALRVFSEMQRQGLQPNEVTFLCIIKACTSLLALEEGRQINSQIINGGFEFDICIGNTLVDMYAKCGSLQDACRVFDKLPKQDVVTWTALIAGYAEHGHGDEALQLFEAMQQKGMRPNLVTLVFVVKACSTIADLEQGRQIHSLIIESGFELDNFVGSSLVDMYGKCRSLDDANTVFARMPKQNIVTWSALITGYAELANGHEALQLFKKMQQEGVSPDKVTFIGILKACSSILNLEEGRQIHALIIESGLEMDMYVGNALVDMFAKCGSLQEAHVLSYRLAKQNVVTWSVLLAGYAQHGQGLEAFKLLDKMYQEGLEPDEITFVGVLKACSSIAALEQGKHIHMHIIESGYELDAFVGSTLIDMYAKCGSLEDACRVFERLPQQNVAIWSALMSGYAQHGDYFSASQYFVYMKQLGLQPDDISFLCLLSACSRMCLVEEGIMHFKSMRDEHGIEPTIKHCNSMVEVLGHAGHLCEAEDLLETLSFQCNMVGWTSLLTSCRTHSNLDIGRRTFDHIVTMDRGCAVAYVLMGNIYSHAGMWEDAKEIEELRRHANVWKKPGKAFIEIGNQVHDFVVGDKTHPQSGDIYAKLEELTVQMRKEGYKPRVDLVLDMISEEDKEDVLCGHCEKLAIAFGLICTPQGTTIRVAKNLRMCADCHTVSKMISKIELREVIVVDSYCIHRFQDGACTCGDNF